MANNIRQMLATQIQEQIEGDRGEWVNLYDVVKEMFSAPGQTQDSTFGSEKWMVERIGPFLVMLGFNLGAPFKCPEEIKDFYIDKGDEQKCLFVKKIDFKRAMVATVNMHDSFSAAEVSDSVDMHFQKVGSYMEADLKERGYAKTRPTNVRAVLRGCAAAIRGGLQKGGYQFDFGA